MDAETARIMNVTLMGLALVGSGLAVLYESRSQTSYRRTARWVERTGLPLLDDADPLWPSIAASMRRTGIAEALSLVAAAAVSLALVATGLLLFFVEGADDDGGEGASLVPAPGALALRS